MEKCYTVKNMTYKENRTLYFKGKCLKENKDVYAKSTFIEKFAWQLENVEIFDEPIEAKGKLSLWEYDI